MSAPLAFPAPTPREQFVRSVAEAAGALFDVSWSSQSVAHGPTLASDARDAWAAWAGLTLGFASRQGWVKQPEGLLVVGIRDAYKHGLEVAVPTGKDELGWALAEEAGR